jgi:LCP family protein required for cell wall assembly
MRTKIIVVASFLVLFVVGFAASVTYLTFKNTISQVIVTANPGTGAPQTPSPTPDPLAPYGVLLLGLRGDNSLGGFLTDTMILALVDPRLLKVTLISIPRDLWVPIPVNPTVTEHTKINAAYVIGLDDKKYPQKEAKYTGAAGGGTLAKDIVSQIFGVPVRYFVSLDFQGFEKSIDILGGVDVTVTKSFEDPYYPLPEKESDPCDKTDEEIKALTATESGDILEHNFMCRYENLVFTKGLVHMDGVTALKFARSRHALNDGSDFARSNRQKQIMLAVKDKVLQLGFITKAIPFIQSLSGDLRTDIPLEVMQQYGTQINQFKNYSISSIALSTDNALNQTYSTDRQYILVPKTGLDNWKSIQEYVLSQTTPSPTPTAKPATTNH